MDVNIERSSSPASSFYSTTSQQLHGQSVPRPPSQQSFMSDLEDVDVWLSRPENVAMLQNLASKAKPKPGRRSGDQPLVAGVENPSEVVSDLYSACQKKGIVPQFNIVEARSQRFQGTLQLGDETISLEVGMRSKKDAKAWLSQQGLPIVEKIEAPESSSTSSSKRENWVGKLLEYANSLAVPPDLDFTFLEPKSQNFMCTLTISPSPLFPSADDWILTTPDPMESKKAAKSFVAERAVATLIAAGELSPEGDVIKKAPAASSNSGRISTPKPETPTAANAPDSIGTRISKLCVELGLPPPAYRFVRPDPVDAPRIVSGGAYFVGRTLDVDGVTTQEGGPVGEVHHIHGKKAAKETCARAVLEFLNNLKKERMQGLGLKDA